MIYEVSMKSPEQVNASIRRKLFLMGLFKIPMIGYVAPKLVHIDKDKVAVRIRLRRRTRNHLKSMYFGALAVGADVAAGIHVFYFAEQNEYKVSMAFKAMTAEFLKRAESDVEFRCEQGAFIQTLLEKSKREGQRENQEMEVLAYDGKNELVARIHMTVSVRVLQN